MRNKEHQKIVDDLSNLPLNWEGGYEDDYGNDAAMSMAGKAGDLLEEFDKKMARIEHYVERLNLAAKSRGVIFPIRTPEEIYKGHFD